MPTDFPYTRVTEPDGSEWVNAEAFDATAKAHDELLAALKNCVDYWPAALNDDLQEKTLEEARTVVARVEGQI